MEKKSVQSYKMLKYVSFGLFSLNAILAVILTVTYDIRFLFGYGFSDTLGYIFLLIGTILIPVGIICTNKTLSAVGCFLLAASSLTNLFDSFTILGQLSAAANAAAYMVAALNCMKKRNNTVILGVVCFVLLVLGIVFDSSFLREMLYGMDIHTTDSVGVRDLINLVAFLLLGFSFSPATAKDTAAGVVQTHSNIERLTKLKELLDKEIISQEEFEEKKKQILDT